MNWTIQLTFFAYTVVVAIVMAYLIVALTVARMDEVYKKAQIHHTVQRVWNIDEINFPFELQSPVKCPVKSRFPLQWPIRVSQPSVQTMLEERLTRGKRNGKRGCYSQDKGNPWLVCVKVNDPKNGRSKINTIQRLFFNQRGDEDQVYRYELFPYDPILKNACTQTIFGTINTAYVRYLLRLLLLIYKSKQSNKK